MKKIMKTLLTVIGIISAGLGSYILWDSYIQKKEQQRKALEAERRTAFLARRKARARARAAARANAALKTEENEKESDTV